MDEHEEGQLWQFAPLGMLSVEESEGRIYVAGGWDPDELKGRVLSKQRWIAVLGDCRVSAVVLQRLD
jgi:hypothetical protein